jgi:hypothetical protein
MTPRSFLIDTKRHPEVLFFRSMASEGNLIPPAPFSPDIPIRKPIPDSDIEDDRDPTDEPYLPDDPGDEPA